MNNNENNDKPALTENPPEFQPHAGADIPTRASEQGSCSGTTERADQSLLPWIVSDLSRSGIPASEAHRIGCTPVAPGGFKALLGFEPPEVVEGYTIEFLDPATGAKMLTPDGRPFVRVKLQRPIKMTDGSTAKYLSPVNGGQQPFIPPEAHAAFAHGKFLVLTEGEKKAIASTLAGYPAVGLVGGWGWWDSLTKSILPVLERYAINESTFYFILDSDAGCNFDFARSVSKLQECLTARGCQLQVIVIPHHLRTHPPSTLPVATIPKIGLDDAIKFNGRDYVSTLLGLASAPPDTPEAISLKFITDFVSNTGVPSAFTNAVARDLVHKTLFDRVSHQYRRAILKKIKAADPALYAVIQTAILEEVHREFSGLPDPVNGGVGIATGVFAIAPDQSEACEVEGVDAELAYIALPGGTSRPYFRRHLVHVVRPSPSATNGLKGGRPKSSPPADAADQFVAQYRDPTTGRPLFIHHRGQWHRYNGKYYSPLPVDDIYKILAGFLQKHPSFRVLSKDNFIKDVMVNLRAEGLCGVLSSIDTPFMFNNGTVEPAPGWVVLKNKCVNIERLARVIQGESIPEEDYLMEHSPRLFGAFYRNYDFEPSAECPMFTEALHTLLPEADQRLSLQMLFGLTMIPIVKFNSFFVWYGPAGTGKSTLLYVLKELVGNENCSALSPSHFLEKHSVGDLTTHLLNIAGDGDTDIPDNGNWARIEGIIKLVTDGGLLRVEAKYQAPFDAPATARFVFATNHLPPFLDRTNGIWDRLRVIPFEQVQRGTAKDNPNLRYEIAKKELPGVFMWAVHGLALLLERNTFPDCARGAEITRKHRDHCDHEGEFLRETVESGAPTAHILKADLYQRYRAWATAQGYRPISLGRFNPRVPNVFPRIIEARIRQPDGTQPNVWVGITYVTGVL